MHEIEMAKFQDWLCTKFKDSMKQAMKEAFSEAQKEFYENTFNSVLEEYTGRLNRYEEYAESLEKEKSEEKCQLAKETEELGIEEEGFAKKAKNKFKDKT
jgi:cation transport regulator ChaB